MAKFWRYQDREQYQRQKAGDILKRNPLAEPLPERVPRPEVQREPIRPLGPQPAPPQPRPSLLRPSTWPTVTGIPTGAGIAKTPWMQTLMGAVGGPEAAQRAEPAVAWERWLSSLTRERVAQPIAGMVQRGGPLRAVFDPEERRRLQTGWGDVLAGRRTRGELAQETRALDVAAWQQAPVSPVVRAAVETAWDPLGLGGAYVAAPLMAAGGIAGVLGKLYMAVDVADMGAYLASATPEELGGVLLLMGAAKLPGAVSKLVRKAWPGVEKVARELPGAARRFAAEEVGAAEIPGARGLAEAGMTRDTTLNITGMQGNRYALEDAGIRFSSTNPSIREIVDVLDSIDARLTKMPASWTRKRASLESGRDLLLSIAKQQSGLAESDFRQLLRVPEAMRPMEVPPEEAARRAREAQEAVGQRRLGEAEPRIRRTPMETVRVTEEIAKLRVRVRRATDPMDRLFARKELETTLEAQKQGVEEFTRPISSRPERGYERVEINGIKYDIPQGMRSEAAYEAIQRGQVAEAPAPGVPPAVGAQRRAPAGPPARPVAPLAEPEVPPARSRMGDRSLAAAEVTQARAEMGTLADYRDRRSFGEFLGSGTRYHSRTVDEQLWAGRAVPVYRASDVETTLTSGSYVTQSRVYAEQHLQSVLGGRGQILEARARADELIPVSPNEFWYAPSAEPAARPPARPAVSRVVAPDEFVGSQEELDALHRGGTTLTTYADQPQRVAEFMGQGTQYYERSALEAARAGNPITVYRATSKPSEVEIRPGAYVTQSRQFALDHITHSMSDAERARARILTRTVLPDELIPLLPNEFWYAPSEYQPPMPVTRPLRAEPAARPPARPAVPSVTAQPVPGAAGILGGPVAPGAGAAVGQPVQPPLAGRGVQITPGGPAAGAVPPTVPPVTGPPTVPPTQLPLWGADNLDLMRTALKWPKPTIKQKLASAVYKFTTGWLDKHAPLKALQRQTGVEVYNLARILPGMQVAGESYAQQYVRPIWQSLGDEIDNAEVYAHLRRALDFREWSPTGKLPGGVQNAAEGLVRLERELGPERIADIHAALEEIWRLNDELILKPLRDEGFPVAKFYEIIKAKWPHYIAWYRQDFEWDEAFRVGPGRQVANMTERVLKRMKIEGSEKRLTSGLARFEAEVIRTPGRIAKNQTARALVRGLQALDAMDGGTRAVRDVPTRTVDRGVVRYWEDGEQQVWQVPAAMERVAKGFDAEPANALMQMLNRASQPLRLGAVVYNPAFVPVNALRDTLSAWITEGLVPFGRQWWGSLVTTIAKNTDWHRGARAGAFLSGFTENVARTTELGRAKRLGKITLKSVGDLVLLVPRLTARANEIVEQTTRLAVFRKLTAEGVPELEAAVRSREVSLDFSKSGNIGRMVNMIVPFFNAGIQGAAKTVDLVAKHPGRTLLRASPLMMISVMTYLWNQRYETSNMIPEYEHALNFVLQVGEGEKKPDPRYPMQQPEKFPIYVKLPKGPMVAGLMAPVEALLRIAFAQDDRSVVEHLLQAAGEVVRSQSPVGPDVGSLLPPVLGTALQLQVNEDFFRGEAIVPEWEETRPPEARYGPEATRQAIALGQKFKVSPRLIDFTVRDVAGGGGRTAGWLLDVALGALGYQPSVPGEARRQPLAREEAISRAPLARRFYGTRRTQQERMAYQKMDVALEDARRGLYESQEAARFGMGVSPPGRTATIEGVPYELAPEQRTEMLRRAAPLVEFGFSELTRRPFYQEKDDLERRGLLDMVRRKVQGNVRDQVLAGMTGMMPGPTWTQADIVRLLDATELLEEYQAIPQYIGLSEEQTQAANAAMGKYNAMRRANPMIPPEVTRSLLAQQDPRAVVLMEMAYSRRNPARRYFWAMHPLLSVFYSDLTEEEVEMVSPMSQMQTRLPSWAGVA